MAGDWTRPPAHARDRRRGSPQPAKVGSRYDSPLTQRQLEVLVLTANGYTGPEIAAELGIDLETVRVHVKLMFLKLNAKNRAHAVTMGFQRGYLTTTLLENLSSPSDSSPTT